jgi:hypothetical protein
VYVALNEASGELAVYAMRAIKQGEEICISHLDGAALFEPLKLRRGMLVLQRSFICLCDACIEAEECAGKERGCPGEKLRADLRALVDNYRRNGSRLMINFGKGKHKGVDLEFATFLGESGAGIVEVVEELGLAMVDSLDW